MSFLKLNLAVSSSTVAKDVPNSKKSIPQNSIPVVETKTDKGTEMTVEHIEAEPLSEEKQTQKIQARQKQLDDIANMKKASGELYDETKNYTKTETMQMNGQEYLLTEEFNNGVKVKGTLRRADGSVAQVIAYKNDRPVKVQQFNSDGKTLILDTNFNENGDILKEVALSNNGEPFKITENEYNEAGKIIKSVVKDFMFGTMSTSVIDFAYYENGNPKSEVTKWADGPVSELKEFNEQGNLLQNISYKRDGSIIKSEIHEYHDNGNIKASHIKSSSRIEDSKYNENGDIIEEYKFFVSYNHSSYRTYEYNENGFLAKCVGYKSDKNTPAYIETFEYNSGGQLVKTTDYEGDGKTVTSYMQHEYYDNVDKTLKTLVQTDVATGIVTRHEFAENDASTYNKITRIHPNGIKFIENHSQDSSIYLKVMPDGTQIEISEEDFRNYD